MSSGATSTTDVQAAWRKHFGADLSAGVTTAIMLIPQAMAYAMLAGLPPIHGLYAATVPLLAYALIGTSRQLAVGPVAMDSLLVAVGVGALAEAGTPTYIAYAILLAFMVGVVQLAMGFARVGVVVDLLSRPVIAGFSSAAALIIAGAQLQHLLGIDLGRGKLHEILIETTQRIDETSLVTLAIAAVSVAVLVILRKVSPKFPRALVVVVAGALVVWGLSLDATGVAIVGEVPRGLPSPALPSIDFDAVLALWPTALAIAFVSFMEAISVAKSVAEREAKAGPEGTTPAVIDANRELIGLGAANALGSLFGGYPVAGGFSRTAVNYEAGAKTRVAGIVSAVVVVLTLLLLTPAFYYLPKAVLAAIIVSAVLGLVQVQMARRLWTLERGDLVLLLLTFAATLVLGIVEGIAVGVGASLLLLALRQTRPHTAILGRLPGTDVFRNVERFPEAETTPGVIAIRVDAPLTFANVSYLDRLIEGLLDSGEGDTPTHALVVDASGVSHLDSSGEAGLCDLDRKLDSRGVTLHFASLRGPVRDMLDRSGLAERLEQRQWPNVAAAVDAVRRPA